MVDKYELMEKACQKLVDDPNNGVHSAGIGYKLVEGKECPIEAIVCQVDKKKPIHALKMEEMVPKSVSIVGDDGITYEFLTDVEESPPNKIELLYVGDPKMNSIHHAQSKQDADVITQLRSCMSPVVFGGAQVAPRGARWVGTLSCAVKVGDDYYSLSNSHVYYGGEMQIGTPVCQPHGQAGEYGKLTKHYPISLEQNASNLIDAAIALDSRWSKTKKEIYVPPKQFKIGRINPSYYKESQIKLGMQVQKVGRTTGHQVGKVVRIKETSYVGYGKGTARYVKQIVIRKDSGNFSDAGDSGSLILDMENRPVALLFAGGGADTIASPIQFVVDLLKIEFF